MTVERQVTVFRWVMGTVHVGLFVVLVLLVHAITSPPGNNRYWEGQFFDFTCVLAAAYVGLSFLLLWALADTLLDSKMGAIRDGSHAAPRLRASLLKPPERRRAR